jgi:hypothetical protein
MVLAIARAASPEAADRVPGATHAGRFTVTTAAPARAAANNTTRYE